MTIINDTNLTNNDYFILGAQADRGDEPDPGPQDAGRHRQPVEDRAARGG